MASIVVLFIKITVSRCSPKNNSHHEVAEKNNTEELCAGSNTDISK